MRSDAGSGCVIDVNGGEFTGCRSFGNGGFMYASDGSLVTITNGTVANNLAERRAGAVSTGRALKFHHQLRFLKG